jgi:site-specific DNA recombinase
MAELESERSGLERDVASWNAEIHKTLAQSTQANAGEIAVTRLAELQERIRHAERRSTEIHEQILALRQEQVTETDVELAMSMFDPIWETLTPHEQTRIVQLLVERVDFNGASNTVSITFHATGVKTLADEIAARQRGKSA